MASLGDLMIRIGVETADAVNGINAFAKELDGIAVSTERNFKALDKMGERMTSLGVGLTAALTAPLAAIGAAAAKAAIDFDEAFDSIRAKTGATGEKLASLGESFKNVFAEVPNSAKDVTDALEMITIRLKMTGEPLEELSTQMLNLARVGGTAVAPLADAMTRAFADWDVEAGKVSKTMDYMYRVSQSTGIGITRLTELVVEFGAPLRRLGFDMETATAMFGRFQAEGVNIETVLSGMRMALGKFAKAGIDAQSGWAEFIKEVKEASSAAAATTLAVNVVGKKAANDVAEAIRQNRFDLKQLVSDYQQGAESINKAAEATMSFADKFKRLRNDIEVALEPLGKVLVGIGEKAIDGMKPLLQTIKEMAEGFAALEPSTQGWILGLAGVAAAAGPVLIILGQMVTGFTALAPVFAMVLASGLEFVTWLTGAAPALAEVTLGTAALVVGIGALAAVINGMQIVGMADDFKTLGDTFSFIEAKAKEGREGVEAFRGATQDAIQPVGLFSTLLRALSEGLGEFKEKMGTLSWTSFLTPLSGVRQEFHNLVEDFRVLVAYFPEMEAAQKKLNASMTASTKPMNDVMDASFKQAAAHKAAAQAANLLGKAADSAGVSLSALSGNQDKAAAAAKRHAEAVAKATEDMYKRYEDVAKASVELPEKLAEMDAKLAASNAKLAESFGKGADNIKKVAETTVAIGDEMATSWENAVQQIANSDTLEVYFENQFGTTSVTSTLIDGMGARIAKMVALVKQELSQLDTGDNPFRNLIFREEVANEELKNLDDYLERTRRAYREHWTYLDGTAMVSAKEMEAVEAKSWEERLAITRKGGKAISDEMVLQAQDMASKLKISSMNLDDAFKTIGSASAAQMQNRANEAEAALNRITAAYEKGDATIGDADRALLTKLQDDAKAMAAAGKYVPDAWKEQMERLAEIVRDGHKNIKDRFDAFMGDFRVSLTKSFDDIWAGLLTGQMKFSDVMKSLWSDLSKAIVNEFLHPLDAAIAKFVASSIKSLMGDQGIAGVSKAFKELGKTAKETFDGIKAGAGAVSGAADEGGVPTSPGGGSLGGGGGVGGVLGAIGAIGSAVSAVSNVVSNFQFAHMNTALGRIEENTRKLWIVTGEQSDSVLATLHDARAFLDDVRNRVAEIRPALFDPVAHDLEGIYDWLARTLGPWLSSNIGGGGTSPDGGTPDTGDATTTPPSVDGSGIVGHAGDVANQILHAVQQTGANVYYGTTSVTDTIIQAGITSSTVLADAISSGDGIVADAVVAGSGVVADAVNLTADQVRTKLDELGSELKDGFYQTSDEYNKMKESLIGKPTDGSAFAGVSTANGWVPPPDQGNGPNWTKGYVEPKSTATQGPSYSADGKMTAVAGSYNGKPFQWSTAYSDSGVGAAGGGIVAASPIAPAVAADAKAQAQAQIDAFVASWKAQQADLQKVIDETGNKQLQQQLDAWVAQQQASTDAQQAALNDSRSEAQKQIDSWLEAQRAAQKSVSDGIEASQNAWLNDAKKAMYAKWAKDAPDRVRLNPDGSIASITGGGLYTAPNDGFLGFGSSTLPFSQSYGGQQNGISPGQMGDAGYLDQYIRDWKSNSYSDQLVSNAVAAIRSGGDQQKIVQFVLNDALISGPDAYDAFFKRVMERLAAQGWATT